MAKETKGLKVTVNLFSLERWKADFTAEGARLWIKGTVTNAESKEQKLFNDAGELITILGRWNRDKLASLKKPKP